MGGEEEIVRIARRLDKMVAKKSAVSGGGWPQPSASGRGAPPYPPHPPPPRVLGRGAAVLRGAPLHPGPVV